MMSIAYLALLFALCSLVAFALLSFSLLNLETLGLRVNHPRVLVEAGLATAFAIAAILTNLLIK